MNREKEVVLHSQQGEVFEARKAYRYRVVASGRRWGETTLGVAELVAGCGEVSGLYWYVAPTMKDAREIAWDCLRGMVPKSWLLKAPNETRLEMEIRGGGKIFLKGADDPNTLRGRGLRGAGM